MRLIIAIIAALIWSGTATADSNPGDQLTFSGGTYSLSTGPTNYGYDPCVDNTGLTHAIDPAKLYAFVNGQAAGVSDVSVSCSSVYDPATGVASFSVSGSASWTYTVPANVAPGSTIVVELILTPPDGQLSERVSDLSYTVQVAQLAPPVVQPPLSPPGPGLTTTPSSGSPTQTEADQAAQIAALQALLAKMQAQLDMLVHLVIAIPGIDPAILAELLSAAAPPA